MDSILKWAPSIFIMSMIFLMSSTTGQTIDNIGFDKPLIQINGHFVMFALLCFTFYRATHDIITSIVFTVFYGVFDEIHQISTMDRNPSLFDIYVDTAAAVLVGLILWKLQSLLPTKLRDWLNS